MPECFQCGKAYPEGEGHRREVRSGTVQIRSTSRHYGMWFRDYKAGTDVSTGTAELTSLQSLCTECCTKFDEEAKPKGCAVSGRFLLIVFCIVASPALLGVLGLLSELAFGPASQPVGSTPRPAHPLASGMASNATAASDSASIVDAAVDPSHSQAVIATKREMKPVAGDIEISEPASVASSTKPSSPHPTDLKPSGSPKSKYHHEYEVIAANRLSLAEAALVAGGQSQARKLLLGIIDEFPETRAAVKARELLVKLPPATK